MAKLSSAAPVTGKGTKSGISNLDVFYRVADYLVLVLRAEWEHGNNPALKNVGLSQRSVTTEFHTQFTAYASGQYPFSHALKPTETALEWWKSLITHPQGRVLAVRIYAAIFISCSDKIHSSLSL